MYCSLALITCVDYVLWHLFHMTKVMWLSNSIEAGDSCSTLTIHITWWLMNCAQGTANVSAALWLGPACSQDDTQRLRFFTSDQPQKSPGRR